MTVAPSAQQAPSGSKRPNRLIRILGWMLIWIGLIVLGSLGWRLYGTGLSTSRAQTALEREIELNWDTPLNWNTPEEAAAPWPTPSSVRDGQNRRSTVLTESDGDEGSALGRIVIAEADVDHVLVEGVTPETLKSGPGHMPWTPIPGQPGNAVVSGHRTTYGAPFFDLDRLEPGDTIVVETQIGEHVYEVRRTMVVEPTDVWVTDPLPGAWLTLTTCTPRYSARQRLVVQAELIDGPNASATSGNG